MKNESLAPAQRETLRRSLQAERKRLLANLERRTAETTDGEVDSADVVDVAEAVIEDRDRGTLDEHDRTLLDEVERALVKMDDGTYGLSEATGRPISFRRLSAIPWARYDSDEAEQLQA